MSDIIDFEQKKCGAKFRVRSKRKEGVKKDDSLNIGQAMSLQSFWAPLMVSAILVLLIIATVPSIMGIMASCIAAAAILFYITGKEGSPAYREVIMLLGWAGAAFALNSVYPLDNLKTPLGALLSGLMIATLFYMYKTTSREKDQKA